MSKKINFDSSKDDFIKELSSMSVSEINELIRKKHPQKKPILLFEPLNIQKICREARKKQKGEM